MEGLHNLGIKGEHQGKLLQLPVNTVDDGYALDIRHPAVMVSPVKKEPLFWPRTTLQLFSSFFVHLHQCVNYWISHRAVAAVLKPARIFLVIHWDVRQAKRSH